MAENILNLDSSSSEQNNQPAVSQEAAPVQAVETIQQSDSSFLSSLSDDLKSNESLKKFKDIDSLAKSYVNLQSMVGSSLRIPSQDASAEAKEEFFKKLESVEGIARLPSKEDEAQFLNFMNKLGRPESPDAYEIPQVESLLKDEVKMKAAAEFKALAHNLGLTNKQAKALMEMDLQRVSAKEEEVVSFAERGVQALKKEFGEAFEGRAQLASAMAKELVKKYPEFKDSLRDPSIAYNPVLIHALAELGKVNQERGTLGSNVKSSSLTPAEIHARISEIQSNKADPYWNASDPNHKARVEYVSKLYRSLS